MRTFLCGLLVLLCACIPAYGQAISSSGTIATNQIGIFVDQKHLKGAVIGTGLSYDGTTLTGGIGTNLSIVGVNGTAVNGPNLTNNTTMVWSNTSTNVQGFPTNIADAQIVAGAAIAKSKISSTGTWNTNEIGVGPAETYNFLRGNGINTAVWTNQLTGTQIVDNLWGNNLTFTNSVKSGNSITATSAFLLGTDNLYALIAGANITFTTNSTRVTIASTGGSGSSVYIGSSSISSPSFSQGQFYTLATTNVIYSQAEAQLGTIGNGATASIGNPLTNNYHLTASGATFNINLTNNPPQSGQLWTITGTNTSGGTQIITIQSNGSTYNLTFPWGVGSTITNNSGADFTIQVAESGGSYHYGYTIGDAYSPAGTGSGSSVYDNGTLVTNPNIKDSSGIVSTINASTNIQFQLASGFSGTNGTLVGTSLTGPTTNNGQVVYPAAAVSTNLDWSSTAKPIQGFISATNFTNAFQNTPPPAGSSAYYSVSNSSASTIQVFFAQNNAATNNFSIHDKTNITSHTIAAASIANFNWTYDGNKYYVTIDEVQGTGGTVTSVAMTVPTDFQVTGTPITTSGTLALTLTNSIGTNAVMKTRSGLVRSIDVPMGAWFSNNIASPGTPLQFTNAADSWGFADAVTNTIRLRMAFPTEWNAGVVRAQFVMSGILTNNTTSTNVVYGIKAASIPTLTAEDAAPTFGTQITFTNHIHRQAFTSTVCTTGDITVGNTPAANKNILWELTRLTSDATDVNTNTVYVLDAQFFYTESTNEAVMPTTTQ